MYLIRLDPPAARAMWLTREAPYLSGGERAAARIFPTRAAAVSAMVRLRHRLPARGQLSAEPFCMSETENVRRWYGS
jgi:hypothetical protein